MNALELYKKGLGCLDLGEVESAHDYFARALEIQPDHPEIIGDMAVVYYHQKRYELSMIFLNRAQELDPDNGYRYSSRAYIKDKLGDIEGAIADYRKAIEIDPDDAISFNNLGLAEERLGYQERAKANFKKADALRKISDGQEENFVMIPSSPNADEEHITGVKDSKRKIIFSVFKEKTALREFIRFVFNGFRLRQ